MKTLPLILCAALALSACANNRFGDNPNEPLDGGIGAGAGNGAIVPGSANDPTSAAYFAARVGDRVLFAVDQSTLTPEGRATLDAQATWLKSNTGFTALIEGHADEQGTREYNLALGGRRANAARDYLITQGIDASRLRTISYGKERPLEVCSTEACYSKNRRAVTVLAAGAGA
jgi:peptidoglycan-associated lipoprotein